MQVDERYSRYLPTYVNLFYFPVRYRKFILGISNYLWPRKLQCTNTVKLRVKNHFSTRKKYKLTYL